MHCPQPWVKKATCKEDLRAYGVNKTRYVLLVPALLLCAGLLCKPV